MATTTVQMVYPADSAVTITLASLASSATFVAGRESDSVSNTSNVYLDYLVSGQVTVGTTPTANTQIRIYAFSTVSASAGWPDVFDGTDSDETITSAGVGQGFLKPLAVLVVDSNTSDRAYAFGQTSLAQAFGGWCPAMFGFFVTHNTAVNLNATGGNHFLVIQPVTTAGVA